MNPSMPPRQSKTDSTTIIATATRTLFSPCARSTNALINPSARDSAAPVCVYTFPKIVPSKIIGNSMPNTDIIPETYVSVNASTGFSWLKIATTTQAIGANIIVLTFLKVRNKIIQKPIMIPINPNVIFFLTF